MSRMHLLVPLDDSEVAGAALPIARMLAKNTDAELTLVTVLPAGTEPGSSHAPAEYLQDLAATQRGAGTVVHTTLRLGAPGRAILEVAEQIHADLIVMATHGRTGLGRTVLGSVADEVLRSSAVPVVVLHPHQRQVDGLNTLLVPVDGTPGGAVALATAVPLARNSKARLVLVRAAMWNEDARQLAEAYVEGLASRRRRSGLNAEGGVVSGQPGAAIVSAAEEVDADLIVMSTHHRGGPARSLLGSVADEVVRRSCRPVLLVRRTQPTREVEPE